jgi:hypothetical protein
MGHNQSGKIALLDSDWMVYRVGFASEDDDEKYALSRLTELLTDTVYFKLGCDDYKAYLTGKTNFRYGVAKTQPYKGNRKDMQKPKHYEALREHLLRLGAVMSENCEADDMVAIEMTKFSDYILVGVDKDLLQIPGKHYNPISELLFDIDEFTGAYNFWSQMLTGDRVDNIPGLRGIGPKKAEKLLKDCKDAEELEQAVWKAYVDKEHDYDYFLEQGRLLHLQRYEGEIWEPSVKGLNNEQ